MSGATRHVVYPGLDTLRAAASVAVVATHTCFWAGIYGHGLVGSAAQRLEVGVAIFFVLSGFLLSQPHLLAAAVGSPRDSAPRYLWKRAIRVLPVYWLCVVTALVVLPENTDLSWRRWVDNLLLVDIFRSENLPHGLTQMWSLSTEAFFYVSLPLVMGLIAVLARHRWRPGVVMATLGVLSFASILWIAIASADLEQGSAWVRRGLPSYVTWFAAGIALAALDACRRTGRWGRATRAVEQMCASPGVCWIIAGSLFVVASTPLAGPAGLAPATGAEAVVRHLTYVGVALLVVAPSIFGDPEARYARLMAAPALRHLGRTSYSLFCCHIIVLELVGDRFGFRLFSSDPFLLFAVVLVLSLAVSEVLYRTVERPFLRLKDAGRRVEEATTSRTASKVAS